METGIKKGMERRRKGRGKKRKGVWYDTVDRHTQCNTSGKQEYSQRRNLLDTTYHPMDKGRKLAACRERLEVVPVLKILGFEIESVYLISDVCEELGGLADEEGEGGGADAGGLREGAAVGKGCES